jgi:hypothetical protein
MTSPEGAPDSTSDQLISKAVGLNCQKETTVASKLRQSWRFGEAMTCFTKEAGLPFNKAGISEM